MPLPHVNRRYWLIPLLWLYFFLALHSMVWDSPTMDEQNHLARGAAYLMTGDPRLSVEHPPLVNTWSALLLPTQPGFRVPLEHSSWNREPASVFWYFFADEFLWQANRTHVSQIIFLGRMQMVWLGLLLGLIGYLWAGRMWGGKIAPFLLMVALLFDPNLLAHTRYITTDMGGTVFVFLATAVFWYWWHKPYNRANWGQGVLLFALVMGLAFTSKLLSLVFVFIWFLLALLPLYEGEGQGTRPWLWRTTQFLTAGFLSIVVVWLVYGLEWGYFLFIDERLIWLNTFTGPMPTFWSGVERIALLSGGGRPSFLLGQFSTEGFWYYFPVLFLVKTPLLLLVGGGVTAVVFLYQPTTRRRTLFLLLPILLYFAISLTSALNIGYRHLLPILPFLYLLLAGGANALHEYLPQSRLRQRFLPLASLLLLLPALLIHPHYLSYFNLLAGGPSNGHNIAIDSNIDWGQDLLRLRAWLAQEGLADVPIKLAWFGTADPAYYGLNYEPLPGLPRHFDLWWNVPFDPTQPEPGVYVLSVSNLWELPLEEKTVFAWFRQREPTARVGYSLHVYVIEED
jgi:hypothetical protein